MSASPDTVDVDEHPDPLPRAGLPEHPGIAATTAHRAGNPPRAPP